ncbi:hypothetical protein C0991_011814, partial [Blastosporella zonata]
LDVSCVCASAQFQQQATACLQAKCTHDDLETAHALQAQQCGAIGVSASGSVTSSTATTEDTTTVANDASTISAQGTTASSSRTTSIAPTSSHLAATTISNAPGATSTNAAMSKEGSLGLVGLMVAGALSFAL